jgi:hypothetical protein
MPRKPKATWAQLDDRNRPEPDSVEIFMAAMRNLFANGAPIAAGEAHLGSIGGKTKTVDVTFSLDTSAYASGDVLADSQIIAACMRANNSTGVLSGFTLHDEDDQGIELDVVFLSANASIGTENAAVSISDANARNILGIVNVASSDWKDLGGVRVATKLNVNVPIVPGTDSDDVYVALITRGTPTHTANGIRGRFHFFQD